MIPLLRSNSIHIPTPSPAVSLNILKRPESTNMSSLRFSMHFELQLLRCVFHCPNVEGLLLHVASSFYLVVFCLRISLLVGLCSSL